MSVAVDGVPVGPIAVGNRCRSGGQLVRGPVGTGRHLRQVIRCAGSVVVVLPVGVMVVSGT